MGDGDWWLCEQCQSLNNFAAGKCYSCRKRKPKQVVRASEYLGYELIETWDGKLTMQVRMPPQSSPTGADTHSHLLPMRPPIPRDITAVAPPPPDGARIVYREAPEPPPAPPAPLPMGPPMTAAGAAWVPVAPPTEGQRLIGVGPGPPSFFGPSADFSADAMPQQAEQWPHWQELLDIPTPKAEKLRDPTAGVGASDDAAPTPRHDGLAFHHAINGDGRSPSDWSVAWPEADLAQASKRQEEAPATSEDDKPAEVPDAIRPPWQQARSAG